MIKDIRQFELFGKQTFVKAIVKPPFRFKAEMHDEACFYYVVSGCADVIVPTKRIKMNATEGFIMQCGNYLNDFLSSNDVEYCEAIAIHLHEDVLKMLYDKEFPDFLLNVKKITPVNYDKIKSSKLLKNYVSSLQFYFENPELVSEEILKIKVKELLILLAKTDNAESIQSLIAGLFSKQEISFKEVIEANIFNNFSIEELASLTHLSLSSFKREFVKHYNNSPAKYIKQRKLEKASKLLKTTKLRVSDIAFDCGFTDLAHFSKSFLKFFKVTPSDFRIA